MNALGFEKYTEPLRLYLTKYREVYALFACDHVGELGRGNRRAKREGDDEQRLPVEPQPGNRHIAAAQPSRLLAPVLSLATLLLTVLYVASFFHKHGKHQTANSKP